MSEILELGEAGKKEVSIKQNLLQKIVNALDKKKSIDNSQFYSEDDLLVDNIKVEIDEVGELSFPLSERCFQKLVNVSSEAHFLPGEQTSVDKNIRNIYEITSDKLHISFKHKALDHMMNKLRIVFGLNNNCILFPHLHNMSIFGEGEFSDTNKDFKRSENTIGFLLIVLPNAHLGGDLEIKFGQKTHTFSSQAIFPIKAKCFAFDAECSHEMKQIIAGHLIALVYNLVLKTEELVVPSTVKKQLNKAVGKYFDLKEDQQKLVYLLNSNYSEQGLKWNILKGEDKTNSLALYSTAKQLHLIPHLAIVEIKENWEINEMFEIESLIYTHIALTFWVDSDNKRVPFSKYYVSESDICFTKGTYESEPYDEKFEKYSSHDLTMGYWYRRAAIVLWPESVKFSINFHLGYDFFLGKLIDLCRTPGNKKKVVEIVTKAGINLSGKYFVSSKDKQNHILNLAFIALYIDSSETAFSLLSNSQWEALSIDLAEQLANLQFKYGIQWCINLLNKMKTNSPNYDLVNSNRLIRSFLESNVDTEVVKLLLDVQYETIINEMTHNTKKSFEDLKTSLPGRIDKLQEFFKNCLSCEDYITLSKMIQNVVSNIQQYPLTCLTELYGKLQENTEIEESVHYKRLRGYFTKANNPKINSELLSEDDWSIKFPLPCECENCATTTSFLQSKTEKTKVWPLREKLRNHIMRSLSGLGLPVDVTVKRTGSPYKLVLVKNDTLQNNNIFKEANELKLCQKSFRASNDELFQD